MIDEENKTRVATVYVNLPLVVDAIKVPGGMLYITSHHEWKTMNTVFVKDVFTQTSADEGKVLIDPIKVKEFLEGKR